MKGRDRFTRAAAKEIRRLLSRLRLAERQEQKTIRARLRRMGFHISDFAGDQSGFTRSDFDDLVQRGVLTIEEDEEHLPTRDEEILEQSPLSKHVGDGRDETVVVGVEQALSALTSPGRSIDEAERMLASAPGLYAIHADASGWEQLGLGLPPDARPLYVGKAEESLIARDIRTHFADGRTGQSTLRRSFAALLRERLSLAAIPRNPAKPERFANYGLQQDGESRLTRWMRSNLRLAGWMRHGDAPLLRVEQALLLKWEPPLNLKDVTTPWTRELRAARRLMADEARQWARDSGFPA